MMAFDFTWLLWGLPLAFALGWVASRVDLRQWRIQSQQAPKAYFRGLNHLLNEQQDQAIDAFIEAVQGDPDTAELHFALGNLFRRRGDYDRAVRVHQHLLSRADLNRKDRERAQHALGMDFLKAGLLDRAEATLHQLKGSSLAQDACLALLLIYERTGDWSQARGVAQELEKIEPGSLSTRLAHYLCEEAQQAIRQGDVERASSLIEQAIKQAPKLARGWLMWADLKAQTGDCAAAFHALVQLGEHSAQSVPLAAPMLLNMALETQQQDRARALLRHYHESALSVDVTQALAGLAPDVPSARLYYLEHLQRRPSLLIASALFALEETTDPPAQAAIKAALQQTCGSLRRYRCAACGFEASAHAWHCPGCQSWDSYPAQRVEEL